MGVWVRVGMRRMVDVGDRVEPRWSATGVAWWRGEPVRGRRKHVSGGKRSCRSTGRRGHVPNVSLI